MSNSDAITSCERPEVRRAFPIVPYRDRKLHSIYVAETDSTRPAYFSRLRRFLMRRGRSREDAEDIIQEALLRLHMYAKKDVRHKEAFLRRTVHNLAIDRYRHDRSRLCCEVRLQDVDQQSLPIAPGPTPDEILDNQRQLGWLAARLDATSPVTRKVYLSHRSGYTHAEIADHMGIAEITIKRHIARARLALMNVDY